MRMRLAIGCQLSSNIMKTLFNRYGVLDQTSKTEKLLRKFNKEWNLHCIKLMEDGFPLYEIRAIDSIAISAISQGTSDAILNRASQMRNNEQTASSLGVMNLYE